MPDLTLDDQTARRFLLDWQGLLPPRELRGVDGVQAWMAHTRCVQFDPLDQCGRNADLTLQSRVRDYRPELLRIAIEQDRSIVEGWDKQMSFFPAEDWPGLARLRDGFGEGQDQRFGDREDLMQHVLGEIDRRGPLSAADLDDMGRVDWHWAPAKAGRAALEGLFYRGDLMITRREGNRKYYDRPRRVVRHEIAGAPDPHPDHQEYLLWRAERRLQATGMLRSSPDAWLGIDAKAQERKRLLGQLTREGRAVEAILDSSGESVWLPAGAEERIRQLPTGSIRSPQAALLAPLDNLMWDRRLIQTLFGFDYVWEVYKPEHQRLWGYYVLPVLYGDRLVARCEPTRNKRSSEVVLKNWWWEPGVRPSARMGDAIRRAFSVFLRFLEQPCLRPAGESWPSPGLDSLDSLRP
ncbi:MAG: winged helix-turn-helix domain-containing protein [Spirochaetales bacterium]|nr:MAG: winged helix-turn-helix domain-containing protein [Spirochaetales bacterium]